jgi:phasin family protein
MMNSFEDMNKAGKDMMDNGMKSAAVLTKGMQAAAAESADFAKKSFEDSTKAFEKLMAVKTIDKAFELQTEFAKNAYEAFVAQSTKMTEMMTAVAKDAYKPFEATVAAVAPKAAK